MQLKKTLIQHIGLIVLLGLFSSCFKTYEGKINIDGSSTVYPLTEAVSEEFREVKPDDRVTVGVSGPGGGFTTVLRNHVAIRNASRPSRASEIPAAKEANSGFIELPGSYDGLAVVVSPLNHFVDYLTVAHLHKMWGPESQRKITNW